MEWFIGCFFAGFNWLYMRALLLGLVLLHVMLFAAVLREVWGWF